MIGAVATKRVWPSYTLFAVSITISSENSPNYRSINAPTSLAQAQRAHSFVQELQHGASSSGGLSTNVDMVARAWGRGEQYPPDDSESEADETGSQVERRYMEATQSEVSDPDLWALNYGDGSDDGETMEG